MKKDINELLLDHEKYHSRFQIENFIVGGQGNAWAQYKQCLREIKSRDESLDRLKDDRELILIDIEYLKRKKHFISKIKKRKKAIRLKSKIRQLKDIDEKITHTARELNHFIIIAKRIKKTSWGDKLITGDLRKSLEAQMWKERCQQMVLIDIMTFGHISHQTMEMIFKMPISDRKELLKMSDKNNRGALIEWMDRI